MTARTQIAIDTTLRWLVYSLRSRGILMAIEFTYRGQQYRVDTPEEVTRLKEHLDNEAREEEESAGFDGRDELRLKYTKWTPDRFVALVDGNNIGHMQKQFLAALLEVPGVISAENVRKRLGFGSLMSLAGVQSALVKRVREIGLEPYDLYEVNISWVEGDRIRYFRINGDFRLVAAEEGWPPPKLLPKKAQK